jgi:hypothetical protein
MFGYTGDDLAITGNGLLSLLQNAIDLLNGFVVIGNEEDLGELLDREDDIDNIQQLATDLINLVSTSLPAMYAAVQPLISDAMRPGLNDIARGEVAPAPDQWRVREYLYWKKSGRFTQALLERAQQAIDDSEEGAQEFRAYAYGYVISYAANVCGNPYINSIVGGPYRTEWWRYRWVSNFIDAWVHGYYSFDEPHRPTVTRDVPMPGEDSWSPGYEEWTNLCGSNLQNDISLPETDIDPQEMMARIWNNQDFPNVLHPAVGRMWDEVFRDVYSADPLPAGIGPGALNDAYVMTWMVLWFQTSTQTSAIHGCLPPDTDPPTGCEVIDPSTLAGATPPPSPGMGSERLFDWGLFLAIIGFLLGYWGAFAGGIGGIIRSMPDDEDWQAFRCYVYWWNMYLVNAIETFHDLLLHFTFVHPHARDLNQGTNMLPLPPPFPAIPYDVGWRLTRSRDIRQSYPARLPEVSEVAPICQPFYRNPDPAADDMFDAMWWLVHPGNRQAPGLCTLFQIENPQRTTYMREEYPDFFITGNPLHDEENDVKTDGASFPFRAQAYSGEPVEFGNAVANAMDLIGSLLSDPSSELPNWNLDADRGMAHLTWNFRDGIYTDPVDIVPES